jgi:alkylation response protein AidB-like acyl-CoA dehydrogenase
MNLELSEEQQELRDNIRAVLANFCPTSLPRQIHEKTGNAQNLWEKMVELGWPGLGIPEEFGGIGMSFVEVAILAEELGRASAPGPLLATTSQFLPILIQFEQGELLSEVAQGLRTGSLALAEGRSWDLTDISCQATATDGLFTITGQKVAVVSGTEVDSFAVVARDSLTHSLGVYLVERGNVTVVPVGGVEPGLALADLTFEAAPARLIANGPDTTKSLEKVLDQVVCAMALHMVGACRRIFEITLEYSKVRVQYDKVIGSFQALKHRFTNLFLAVERANAVGYFAAVAIAEDDERRCEAAHMAKVSAGECQQLLVEDGLQLHGGIGYTWENDLHFWLKRAKAGEFLFGSSAFHRSAIAKSLGLLTEVTI